MSSCNLSVFLLLGSLVLGHAMPQGKDDNKDVGFGLPFIQFKNGGIRFNFAGYHAEAGLGGLLDTSNAGGGLHASAGTPWGAHAAAGLGGSLGGQDASAGGGLYARAGLGRGRPEAAAGLGGLLDGSGRSNAPVSGGLFAGATTGQDVNTDVGGANPINGQPPSNRPENGQKNPGRSSIQIISRSGKSGKLKESHGGQVLSVPSTSAGVYGTVYADSAFPGSKDVEKIKASNGRVIAIPEAPEVLPLPQTVNEVVESDNGNRGRYPIWNIRKRFFLTPRKRVVYETVESIPASFHQNSKKISRRQVQTSRPERPEMTTEADRTFDHVFNIPISVLTSVNQLLKNNSE